MPRAPPRAPITRELKALLIDKLRTSVVVPEKYWGSDSRPASPTAQGSGPRFGHTEIEDEILLTDRNRTLAGLGFRCLW